MALKLLLVDDSPLIRFSLLGLLEDIPAVEMMAAAATLAEASDSIRREAPSLLILDLHLPDGNAIPAIRPMKRLAPAMQIAVLTNDASAFNRDKCLRAGADWFFDKSTEFEKVIEVVQMQAARNAAATTTRG